MLKNNNNNSERYHLEWLPPMCMRPTPKKHTKSDLTPNHFRSQSMKIVSIVEHSFCFFPQKGTHLKFKNCD